MRFPSRPIRLCAALAAACLLHASSADAALTDGARLAAIYDTILQGRVDAADATLSTACAPAPAAACRALLAISMWWRIQMDPGNRRYDRELERRAAAAIDAAERWTEREPKRGEAWFYLAGSYAPLVQWRILRGERLAAAREAARIKNGLERSLALDPSLDDAWFGIGLYHYYAEVAPAAARVLRWLLLLPGGDRERGLAEMLKARDGGTLMRGEADYQLHWIYLWYEKKPGEALRLLRGLDQRYPSNPIFLLRIAEVQREYLSDDAASAATWEQLLARAQQGSIVFAATFENAARLGLAAQQIALSQNDRAIEQLTIVIKRGVNEPYGAIATAQLRLGNAYEGLRRHDLAAIAYRDAIAAAPRDDSSRVAERARRALRTLGRRK